MNPMKAISLSAVPGFVLFARVSIGVATTSGN